MKHIKKSLVLLLPILFVLFLSSCKLFKSRDDAQIDNNTQENISVFNTASVTVSESSITTSIESESTEIDTNSDTETSVTTVWESSPAEGGNPVEITEIEITVSENQYYYDNAEISFDELTELIDGLGKNNIVKIYDDYASAKAYENLTSLLDKCEIPYKESVK